MPSTIQGRLVRLRPMTRDDLSLVHGWLNDPDVMQFWDGRDHPASFDRVEARFRASIEGVDRELERWAIELSGSEARTIGMAQHTRLLPRLRTSQVDLLIGDPSYRDAGYGTDAMTTLLDHLFGTLRAHRVWCTMRELNEGAAKGAEKCGFVREGVLREHDQLEGRRVNVVVYGMLESEWKVLRR